MKCLGKRSLDVIFSSMILYFFSLLSEPGGASIFSLNEYVKFSSSGSIKILANGVAV